MVCGLWGETRDENGGLAAGEHGIDDSRDLIGCFSGTVDDFADALAKFPVHVERGVSEFGGRGGAQFEDGVVNRHVSLGDLR